LAKRKKCHEFQCGKGFLHFKRSYLNRQELIRQNALMKNLLYICVLLMAQLAFAQPETQADPRRPATKEEVRVLAHLTDSVLIELKNLYKLEVKENSPRKYQPERIALVRSYLLVFQHIENGCGIVSYTSKDITQIFGKPDTTMRSSKATDESEWLYGKLQTKYVRINNLRYRFYFKKNILEAVKRDDG
jgi:hypothetical protein